MSASPVKELYNSSNGDRWVLSKNPSGMLVVSHHPNSASGGRVSEIGVDVFLAQGGRGPERQALVEALANLDVSDSLGKLLLNVGAVCLRRFSTIYLRPQ